MRTLYKHYFIVLYYEMYACVCVCVCVFVCACACVSVLHTCICVSGLIFNYDFNSVYLIILRRILVIQLMILCTRNEFAVNLMSDQWTTTTQ